MLLLLAVAVSMGVFAEVMYWMDPLLHYGAEKDAFTYYEYSEMYSNPGIAKHYSYDAVLVGTSMVQNTNVDLCDELWGCDMVRLTYSGGTSYNMKTILDICFASGNDIKTVYWELDQFQLTGSPTEPRYPLPAYLYQMDHSEDLSYLLNLDIFYHYGLNNVLGMLRGDKSNAERRYETLTGDFSRSSMLMTYNRPYQKEMAPLAAYDKMKKKVDDNLQNITSLMQAHPDTEFVFFMPPFSVLYWDRELRNGTFDVTMDSTHYALKKLLEYDNVRIYFYQGEEDIITNLDNYKDFSHYGSWINDLLTEYIAEDINRVTKENNKSMIDEMREFIYNYDFDSIFQ
jgi:hypothetical protein